MARQIVENLESFSEAEQEALEFLPEQLENIESELDPELESISPEEVAKDLEVYFQGNIQEVGLERGGGVSGNINVNVDLLGFTNLIISSINFAKNRPGFVKNLCNTAFYNTGQRYNVMVMNLSINYEDRLSDIKFYASAKYGSVIYGIWVFERGTFINKGDGGYINWALRGWFQKNKGYVRFWKP